jgi:hypothetical protein
MADDPEEANPWRTVAGVLDDLPEEFDINRLMDLLPSLYMLDQNHQPVRAKTWREWCEWNATTGNQVACDRVGDAVVSTVFLTSSPHPLLPGGQFETMIFGGPHNDWRCRWASWDEAVKGHQVGLALARTGLH